MPAANAVQMAQPPEYLTLAGNRDRAGQREAPVRRVLVILVALVCLAGLLNVFGQHPETSEAAVPDASLKVYAASRVRGGLYYEARMTVTARRDVKNATLVLDRLGRGITINTVEPSRGRGKPRRQPRVRVGRIPAGTSHILFLHLQVNPTNIGHRSQTFGSMHGDSRF